MGDVIDEFIMKKLDDAIKEASSSEFHLAAKLFLRPTLSHQFNDLKVLLQAKRDAIAAADTAPAVTTDGADEKKTSPAVTTDGADEKKTSPAATTAGVDEPKTAAAATAPAANTTGADEPKTTAGADEPKTAAGADEPKTAAAAAPAATTAGADEPKTTAAAAPAATTAGADEPKTTAAAQANLLREQLYYINNVLTEWQTITKKPFSISCESFTSLTNLSQSLKKIKQDLSSKKNKQDSVRDGGSATPITSNVRMTFPNISEEPLYRWSSRFFDKKQVYGIEDKVLSMERLLVLRRDKNDPFKAFGIFGMAGIGKTTLCQSIFSRPKVQEYFLPRIWVCMSKQKDDDKDPKKEIVKRMLMCLGLDNKIIKKTDEGQGLRGLIFTLRLQLTGKRYLIVLDDACIDYSDEWFKMMDSSNEDENLGSEKFAYGLPKGCGGTVIVTGRKKAVVENMVGEEQNLRCLMPFTDEETCWNIFRDSVKKDGIKFPMELDELKEDIVKMCAGLPLAAKMLGEIKHQQILPSAKAIQAGAAQQEA